MSAFSTTFQHGRALHDAYHKADVPYQPADKALAAITLRANAGAVMEDLIQGEDGRTLYRQRIVEATRAVDGTGVMQPQRGGLFTIDDEPWTVDVILSIHQGDARARCVRPVQIESALRTNRGDRRAG